LTFERIRQIVEKQKSTIKGAVKKVIKKCKLEYNAKYVASEYSKWHQQRFSVQSATSTRVLSEAEEAAFVGLLNAYSFNNIALKPNDSINLVRDWKQMGPNWNGWGWWNSFLKRQPDLVVRRASESTRGRDNIDVDATKKFIDMVNEMHQKYRFPRKAIFNIDETKWFIKRGKIIRQVVGSPGGKQNLEESRSQTVASSVQVVSADGTGFLQAIIFKAGKWQAKSRQ